MGAHLQAFSLPSIPFPLLIQCDRYLSHGLVSRICQPLKQSPSTCRSRYQYMQQKLLKVLCVQPPFSDAVVNLEFRPQNYKCCRKSIKPQSYMCTQSLFSCNPRDVIGTVKRSILCLIVHPPLPTALLYIFRTGSCGKSVSTYICKIRGKGKIP